MMIRLPAATVILGATLLAMWAKHDRPASGSVRSAVQPQQDSAAAVAQLKRAIRLNSDAQYGAAIATYDSAAARLPQLADWIAIFSAASAAYRGDTVEVTRRLSRVDTTLLPQWGWRARTRALVVAGQRERALAVARAATAVGTASNRADAWLRVAELQRELGDAPQERAALLRALQVTARSDAAAKAAAALAEQPRLTIEERLQVGRSLMSNGDIGRGIRVLEQALETGQVAERSQLRYEMGRALFDAGRYAEAARQLSRVATTHPRGPDARYLLARAEYRDGRITEGKRTLRAVARDYPASPAATRALFLLADLAQDDGNIEDAVSLFERAANAPNKVDESARALMRRGAIAYVQGDYARAAAVFDSYRSRYRSGEYYNQATYWAAQTALRRGNESAAQELLRELRRSAPLSYYGLRATERLGSPFQPGVPAGPAVSTAAQAKVRPTLDRWQLLREVGWNEPAAYEISRLRRSLESDTNGLYEFAEEMHRRGAPHFAISAGRDLLNAGGWNQRLLRIMYPMPWQEIIEREARTHGLDPYFVAALIRQESSFNPNARSGAGAVGLMQIMPATGRMLGRQANVGEVTPARLTDPALNIKLGTRFMADLVRTYGNRLDVVLAAYNAGPTRAQNWRQFPEFGTEDLFIERIPFNETRHYVKVVMLNAAVYRSLYGSARAGTQ